MAIISNSSDRPVKFRFDDDGAVLTIEPGGWVELDLTARVCRLCCWECGLSDGSHHTWCPLWLPYRGSE